MSYVKPLQNYKKCFTYTTILAKKNVLHAKHFPLKSVFHAKHISIKLHKIAHLSVILNISKSVIILMYRHCDLHSYIGYYYKTTTPKMR